MLNYLKADFSRLYKSKARLITLLILIGGIAFGIFIMAVKSGYMLASPIPTESGVYAKPPSFSDVADMILRFLP